MLQNTSLFSVGYATKPVGTFLQQLKDFSIDVVVDVRSVPYSKAFFDYHQPAFKRSLTEHQIKYVYLGKELGPRSPDASHYDSSGQVQFDLLMNSQLFAEGITRLFNGLAKGYRIVLACAEKDPATCHRSLLIGYALWHRHQLEIAHILHDGGLETQTALEQRLMMLTEIFPDMLTSHEGALDLAWKKQCQSFAWRRPESGS